MTESPRSDIERHRVLGSVRPCERRVEHAVGDQGEVAELAIGRQRLMDQNRGRAIGDRGVHVVGSTDHVTVDQLTVDGVADVVGDAPQPRQRVLRPGDDQCTMVAFDELAQDHSGHVPSCRSAGPQMLPGVGGTQIRRPGHRVDVDVVVERDHTEHRRHRILVLVDLPRSSQHVEVLAICEMVPQPPPKHGRPGQGLVEARRHQQRVQDRLIVDTRELDPETPHTSGLEFGYQLLQEPTGLTTRRVLAQEHHLVLVEQRRDVLRRIVALVADHIDDLVQQTGVETRQTTPRPKMLDPVEHCFVVASPHSAGEYLHTGRTPI